MSGTEHPPKRTVALVRALDQHLHEVQREKLRSWAATLLRIRESNLSAQKKAVAAIQATLQSGIVRDLLSRIMRLAMDAGWRERAWPARLGIGAAVLTLATVGNQGAGIAALGGAVGLPLWMVLGAGGTLAGTLVQELASPRERTERPRDTAVRDDHLPVEHPIEAVSDGLPGDSEFIAPLPARIIPPERRISSDSV